jgi:hypothetical protein
MTSPPGDGTEPLDPDAARWGSQPTQPTPEPVSLDKPASDEPLDFDPYRFGKPDYPISPEYAPPGYTGPVTHQPPVGYPPPMPYSAQQPPAYPNFPAVPPPPPYNVQYPQPRTGNGKAIAAMVLGIGSIVFCWLSIFDAVLIVPAVIFGAIALTEANRKPTRDGRGMAITGLSCALVGAVLATVFTFYVYNKVKDCIDYGVGSTQYNQCIKDHF